jgi:hypothetical protein
MAPRRRGEASAAESREGRVCRPSRLPKTCLPTGRTEAQPARAEGCLLRPRTPAGARPFQADYSGLERRAPLLARMAPGRSLRGNGPVEPTEAEGLEPPTYGLETEPKPYDRAVQAACATFCATVGTACHRSDSSAAEQTFQRRSLGARPRAEGDGSVVESRVDPGKERRGAG